MLPFVSSLFRSLDTITIAFAPFNLYTLKLGKNFFCENAYSAFISPF